MRYYCTGVLPVFRPSRELAAAIEGDPFSSEIEVLDIDGMPPLKEPMPKVRPHNDLIIKYLQDIPEFASGRAVSYCQSERALGRPRSGHELDLPAKRTPPPMPDIGLGIRAPLPPT